MKTCLNIRRDMRSIDFRVDGLDRAMRILMNEAVTFMHDTPMGRVNVANFGTRAAFCSMLRRLDATMSDMHNIITHPVHSTEAVKLLAAGDWQSIMARALPAHLVVNKIELFCDALVRNLEGDANNRSLYHGLREALFPLEGAVKTALFIMEDFAAEHDPSYELGGPRSWMSRKIEKSIPSSARPAAFAEVNYSTATRGLVPVAPGPGAPPFTFIEHFCSRTPAAPSSTPNQRVLPVPSEWGSSYIIRRFNNTNNTSAKEPEPEVAALSSTSTSSVSPPSTPGAEQPQFPFLVTSTPDPSVNASASNSPQSNHQYSAPPQENEPAPVEPALNEDAAITGEPSAAPEVSSKTTTEDKIQSTGRDWAVEPKGSSFAFQFMNSLDPAMLYRGIKEVARVIDSIRESKPEPGDPDHLSWLNADLLIGLLCGTSKGVLDEVKRWDARPGKEEEGKEDISDKEDSCDDEDSSDEEHSSDDDNGEGSSHDGEDDGEDEESSDDDDDDGEDTPEPASDREETPVFNGEDTIVSDEEDTPVSDGAEHGSDGGDVDDSSAHDSEEASLPTERLTTTPTGTRLPDLFMIEFLATVVTEERDELADKLDSFNQGSHPKDGTERQDLEIQSIVLREKHLMLFMEWYEAIGEDAVVSTLQADGDSGLLKGDTRRIFAGFIASHRQLDPSGRLIPVTSRLGEVIETDAVDEVAVAGDDAAQGASGDQGPTMAAERPEHDGDNCNAGSELQRDVSISSDEEESGFIHYN